MTPFETLRCSFLAAALGLTTQLSAEDWGAYLITPVSAPAMVLEAVESGTAEGTLVSFRRATVSMRSSPPTARL
jgi:hypothetical protein